MRVTVELTYDMSKALGTDRFDVEDVATVRDLNAKARERVGPTFEAETRLAAVAVNGVLTSYESGLGTRLTTSSSPSPVPASHERGRVASHLRLNLAWADVRVSSPEVDRQGRWLVEGATHFELQTLARIERLSAWLRLSASKHQVYLVGLALAREAPAAS